MLPYDVPTRIGPSDYVPFLDDEKVCYLHAIGHNFGDNPINVNLKLSVQDSPNSAGVMIDVIRALAIAQDRVLKDLCSLFLLIHLNIHQNKYLTSKEKKE